MHYRQRFRYLKIEIFYRSVWFVDLFIEFRFEIQYAEVSSHLVMHINKNVYIHCLQSVDWCECPSTLTQSLGYVRHEDVDFKLIPIEFLIYIRVHLKGTLGEENNDLISAYGNKKKHLKSVAS